MSVLGKRSTVYLDPALHRALRLKSLETAKSMSELINAAVRESLVEGVADNAGAEIRDGEPAISSAGRIRIICWQDGDFWLGYPEEYPDYMTQGLTIDELKENIKDIYLDLSSGKIPCARREEELVLA